MARILIVDDNDLVRQSLKIQIEAVGHNVCVAAHGGEGLGILAREEEPVDVVISDLHMPEVEGMEFIIAMRRHGHTTPVIVMTGGAARWSTGSSDHMSEEYLKAAVKLGAQKRIMKPFTSRQILELIDECLAEKNTSC